MISAAGVSAFVVVVAVVVEAAVVEAAVVVCLPGFVAEVEAAVVAAVVVVSLAGFVVEAVVVVAAGVPVVTAGVPSFTDSGRVVMSLASSSTLPASETFDATDEIAHCSLCLSMNAVFSEARQCAADVLRGIPASSHLTKLSHFLAFSLVLIGGGDMGYALFGVFLGG